MQELHIIAVGKVQGIGFRAKVKAFAEALKLTGHVRNLSNGDVEICVQGSPDKLQILLQQIQQSFKTYIQDLRVTPRTPSTIYSEFRITLV